MHKGYQNLETCQEVLTDFFPLIDFFPLTDLSADQVHVSFLFFKRCVPCSLEDTSSPSLGDKVCLERCNAVWISNVTDL